LQKIQAQVVVGDTEFWFAAPDIDGSSICGPGDSPIIMLITNNSTQTAHVNLRLYNGGSPIDIPQTIPPDGSWRYDIPNANKGTVENPLDSAGYVTNYGIHITSDVKVTAYYQVQATCNQDLFALKGKPALGTFFYVPMVHDSYYYTGHDRLGVLYPLARDQIDIVATRDNTVVRVVPTADIRVEGLKWNAGDTLVRTLNKGQTLKIVEYEQLRIEGSASLAATCIQSTRPVAVTTTEDLIGRAGFNGYDLIGDQIVPVATLGKRYVVIKGYNTAPERVYMIATEDGTVISVAYAGTVISSGTLNAGDCWMYNMGNQNNTNTNVITVYADNPFYCYQVTGDIANELGSALLPDVYAVSQTQVSFFSHYNIFLSLLFRTGSEGDFTLSYGSVNNSPITLTATMTVPGMPEWTAAKFAVPAATQGNVVMIKNTSSMFGLGCFVNYPTAGFGTSYGYLSSYQMYALSDTTYKCEGADVTLDAGYGDSYEWTLPDGSTLNTPTITATDTGLYIVTVTLNQNSVTDTTLVLTRFEGSFVAITDIDESSFTYSVFLAGQTDEDVLYEWTDGSTVLSTGSTLTLPLIPTEEKLITLTITDGIHGCSKTFYLGNKLPDNIDDAECFVDPISKPFTFSELASTPTNYKINNYNIPLVGDIDNDGFMEIIVPGYVSNGVSSNVLYIFKFKNGQVLHQQTISTPYFNTVANPYSIAKVDGNDYAAIFLCTDNTKNSASNNKLKLIKYIYNGLQYIEQKRVTYSSLANKEMAQPMITDFNGDGIPEVVTYDRVFNARTMDLLVDGDLLRDPSMGFGAGSHFNNNYNASNPTEASSVMAIGDMDNDGYPEIIGGNCVYKVQINSISDTTNNSFTLWSKCNKIGPGGETHSEANDGSTAIADVDNDGYLDIIVTVSRAKAGGNYSAVYVWNPRTQKVLHTNIVNISPYQNAVVGPSVPFIGDIDKNGKPAICFAGVNAIYAFRLEDGVLKPIWSKTTLEDTGATSMVMFDFNQDGENELVYRDGFNLRILEGASGENLIPVLPCFSETASEYPLVVDINNDGAAEIVVTGDNKVRIFSSNPIGLWAPARKVWNQYSFNVVNINEDLTVPAIQMNPATIFSGPDGQLGTSDDVRPYNGYLQQQTTLSVKGTPLWTTPNIKSLSTNYAYYQNGDSLHIYITLTNTGSAPTQIPYYITAYNDAVNTGNLMVTGSVMQTIQVKDTIQITLKIDDFSDFIPLDRIIIRLNDKGQAAYDQAECDYSSNEIIDVETKIWGGVPDMAVTPRNQPIEIDVLANDDPDICDSTTLTLASNSSTAGGTATLITNSNNHQLLAYTPPVDFTGIDTVEYILSCNIPLTVKVYILVYDSLLQRDTTCINSPIIIGFPAIEDVVYRWYTSPNGNIPEENSPNPITVIKDIPSLYTWWVEAVYNGMAFPRIPVRLQVISNTVTYAGKVDAPSISPCAGTVGVQLMEDIPAEGIITCYLWQISTDSIHWTNAPALNTGIDYTYPEAINEKTYFRRAVIGVTNICDTLYSYIVITPNPVPVVTFDIKAICLGTSIILPSLTNGTWRNDSTHITNMDNNNVITGIAAGKATFVFTDNETGCAAGISMQIDTFPDAEEITGKAVVCINQSIELSNPTPNGSWSTPNANITFNNPTANPVTVTGVTEGKTFITYTISNGICQTKRTHQLKIISDKIPNIIIGIER
jgi:hypothetical protein